MAARITSDFGDDEAGNPLRPAFSQGDVHCFAMGTEFYVYRSDDLIRVCPSIGMAREVAAGAAA